LQVRYLNIFEGLSNKAKSPKNQDSKTDFYENLQWEKERLTTKQDNKIDKKQEKKEEKEIKEELINFLSLLFYLDDKKISLLDLQENLNLSFDTNEDLGKDQGQNLLTLVQQSFSQLINSNALKDPILDIDAKEDWKSLKDLLLAEVEGFFGQAANEKGLDLNKLILSQVDQIAFENLNKEEVDSLLKESLLSLSDSFEKALSNNKKLDRLININNINEEKPNSFESNPIDLSNNKNRNIQNIQNEFLSISTNNKTKDFSDEHLNLQDKNQAIYEKSSKNIDYYQLFSQHTDNIDSVNIEPEFEQEEFTLSNIAVDKAFEKMIEKISYSSKKGTNIMHIGLKPEFLGHMQIKSTFVDKSLVLEIWADKQEIRKLLLSKTQGLVDLLAEKGLSLEEVRISEKDRSLDLNYEGANNFNHKQGTQNNNHESSKRALSYSINSIGNDLKDRDESLQTNLINTYGNTHINIVI